LPELVINTLIDWENTPVNKRKGKKKGKSKPSIIDDESDLTTSSEVIEEADDGIFVVRKISGSTSNKPYRCPGCDQVIPMATPHTVAWLEHDQEGRRHWHNICWSKRNMRKPKIERTRNAPRY
jgi:hypothetical protein